ncbi:MAG: toxin-antitoxin system YwqK family antitoxin [Chitinophagales bacterium]
MIQKIGSLLLLAFMLLTACESGSSSSKKEGLVKKTDSDGTVTEINYKEGKKHGVAKTYYSNGNISAEIEYVEGVKQGEAKWYYKDKDELLYQVTNFVDSKKEGLRTRYHRNGKVMVEIPYKNGGLSIGTKEFSKKGNPITDHENVKIEVQEKNQLKKTGEYILELRLPRGYTKVKWYHGDLTDGSYMNEELVKIKNEKGVGTFRIKVPPNTGVTREFNIVAHAKTALGNDILFQQKKTVNANNY